jgi:hypothetical protein
MPANQATREYCLLSGYIAFAVLCNLITFRSNRGCYPAVTVKIHCLASSLLMDMDIKSFLKAHPSVIGLAIGAVILIYIIVTIATTKPP